MSPNNKKAFVRAKPAKIVIEELYQYKADIQETLRLSFEKDKSRGEIKIEFVYDGERLAPGWERAVRLRGLQKKWELPSQIRRRMKALGEKPFIGPVVRGIGWVFGWVWRIIWWLPGYLIRQYFKLDVEPEPSMSFGALALADVEKYGEGLTKALVGYLALRGYSKSAFGEDWPEYRPLPLEVRVDDLESKISNSQKHVIKYQYPLYPLEPPKEPVRLGSVSLYDNTPHDHSDLDIRLMDDARVDGTDMGEMLWLKIPLTVDIDPPDLDEKNQLKPDVARGLWKKGAKSKESQEKQATAQESEKDLPFADQLAFFTEEEWDDRAIEEKLSRLSRQRGGYLFFTIGKKDEKSLEKLQNKVLRIALKCSPPVPIMKPYAIEMGGRSEQQLAIVPVPRRMRHSSGYPRGPVHMEGYFTYDGATITESHAGMWDEREINWRQLTESDDSLSKELVALANTNGGDVIVEIGPEGDRDTLAKVIQRAHECRPSMTRWIFILPSQSMRGKVLRVIVPSKLPYIFTHKDKAWMLKGSEVKEMEPNGIYELFKDRGELHYPTLVHPPVVTYARIEWPHMDYRKRQGIHHDPDNRALEWVNIDKETMQQTSYDVFGKTLEVQIMHPVELYQMGHVKGQIRVQFNRQIWSGLDVVYFDATGQRRPHGNEGKPEMVKSTTVVIDLDITLNAIFKRRPFYSYRRLEFEGVKPDPDRLADIVSLLADLGLEDINVRADLPLHLPLDLSNPAIFEEVVSRWGILITGHIYRRNQQVKLRIAGSPQIISRQRKDGKHVDRMQIPTGLLRITLAGKTRGESPPLELSRLLNQIQHLLKERFSFVRMHLK